MHKSAYIYACMHKRTYARAHARTTYTLINKRIYTPGLARRQNRGKLNGNKYNKRTVALHQMIVHLGFIL